MKICILDGEQIKEKEQLHDVLVASLGLPDWYGRNLDALYDCLTDIREETEIRLIRLPAMEAHLGRYARALQKVIHDASEENSVVHVLFCAEE